MNNYFAIMADLGEEELQDTPFFVGIPSITRRHGNRMNDAFGFRV
jgi:hypothetical protein